MTEYFYKNADADEVIFVHEGSGIMKTVFGEINFEYGDYLVVPRGIIYQLHFNDENNRLFITESFSPITPPKRYLNKYGQFLEHSPYCERDIKLPQNLQTHDELGDFKVMIKKQDMIFPTHWEHIHLMPLGGTGTSILLDSAFTIMSQSQAAFTCRLQFTRHLKDIIL
jgi:homogentisate 1,2-dioxygenase